MIIHIATERNKILAEIDDVKFKIETYDATLSDSDEYPYTKDELETKLNYLELKLKEFDFYNKIKAD